MRLSIRCLWLVPLTCLVLFGTSSPSHAEGEWPFGAAGRAALMRGGDYINLGVLGAKAWDADRPKPSAPQPGMRRGRAEPDAGGDTGPNRLEIVVLHPAGPAKQAGLRLGDVIVGIGRKAFAEDSLEKLAEALRKAETGTKKGVLVLLIEREGTRQTLEVNVPQRDKSFKKPVSGAARRVLLDEALAFLETQQQDAGGFSETLSGQNGAVVQTAMAGLAWLTRWDGSKEGAHAAAIAKAARWLRSVIGGALPDDTTGKGDDVAPGKGIGGFGPGGRSPGLDQSGWGYAHAAIFLGELHARAPRATVRATLFECARRLVTTQETSGGWAHGPGGPNPLGYTELNIMTGLALCGLALAAKAGYEVPTETIDKAEAYLMASSGGGGVGYSANPGQKGQGNIGRTAACWLGLRQLRKGKFVTAMQKYADRSIDQVLGGHASLMQHILLAGVAAPALGSGANKRYWKAMLRDFTLARAPDGSFQPRSWHESLGIGSNSDVTFGQIWTTAAWAVVLGCDRDKKQSIAGLPAWLGAK